MMQKTQSYIDACKAVWRMTLQDLENKGLTKNRIPSGYPFSRRTLYAIRAEFMGEGSKTGYISLETFSKAAEYFGVTIIFSLTFAKDGSPKNYPLLDSSDVDSTLMSNSGVEQSVVR